MMRKAEFTFRDLTVRYLYDVPAQADAYLPMILYIPDSSLDHGYEKFISGRIPTQSSLQRHRTGSHGLGVPGGRADHSATDIRFSHQV